MNTEPINCDICACEAAPREWLRCMLCGKRYHFAPQGSALAGRDCGIVAPNPASSGC